MPIKFHPVVFNLEGSGEDSLISSDSASTEAPSPEELRIPERYRVQRSRTLRTEKVTAAAVRGPGQLCLLFAQQQNTRDSSYYQSPIGKEGESRAFTQPLLKASTAFLPRNVFHFFNINTNQIYYIPVIFPGWGLRKLHFLGTKGICA